MIPASTSSSETAASAPRFPLAALILVAGSLGTLALLARHPTADIAGMHDPFAILTALAQGGAASAHMHGELIGVLGAMLYGVIAFAATLERRGSVVVFGVAAYGLGFAAMIGAMLLDGFVTAPLAQRLLDVKQLGGGTAAFALLEFGIQLLTKTGFCAMGVAMCCLSWAQPRTSRMLAWMAVASGVLPVVTILAAGVHLAPHSLILIAGLQALWYCAAGYHLWRKAGAVTAERGVRGCVKR